MKISVEYKVEASALKAAFFSKAHYPQLAWDSQKGEWSRKMFKIRGAKLSPALQKHPCYTLLEARIEGKDVFQLDLAPLVPNDFCNKNLFFTDFSLFF